MGEDGDSNKGGNEEKPTISSRITAVVENLLARKKDKTAPADEEASKPQVSVITFKSLFETNVESSGCEIQFMCSRKRRKTLQAETMKRRNLMTSFMLNWTSLVVALRVPPSL